MKRKAYNCMMDTASKCWATTMYMLVIAMSVFAGYNLGG